MKLDLNTVYKELDFESGDLFYVASWREGNGDDISEDEVLNKEKWFETCRKINERYKKQGIEVDAIFFIQQNPIAIFAKVNKEKEKTLAVRILWNLARPRYLFLYDLNTTEVYDLGAKLDLSNPTPYAKGLAQLIKINREIIQSGYDLLNDRKEKRKTADVLLIQDLKELRRILVKQDKTRPNFPRLLHKQAHTLIAQVIFIRYLEDRQILDKKYFINRVIKKKKKWLTILNTIPDKSKLISPELGDCFFPRILKDRNFTIALFKQLTTDFNGDVFAEENNYEYIKQEHLTLIQQFLWASLEHQQKLFLWAYKFDVIPLELISSIYEEFYHSANDNAEVADSKGTHYTPSVLVEFMLSQVLTIDRLATNPRILDPACGSGIFLVEAFRRIVRYKKIIEGLKPNFNNLQEILAQQIRGIEINLEATRVTAFSIYISLLDFLDPPYIRLYIESGEKLPYLLYTDRHSKKHLNIILDANAFWVEHLFNQDEGLKDFQPDTVDIIVGNPPWKGANEKDIENKKAIDWCRTKGFPISDNEWSQMFIWRAYDLLKPNGIAGLFVSSGTLFKSSDKSILFKKTWTSKSSLIDVYNFVLTRHTFFEKAVSPFFGVIFQKKIPSEDHKINYWTFRRSKVVEKNQIVLLDKSDFKVVPQRLTSISIIWKIFQYGNNLDFSLISGLQLFDTLEKFEKKIKKRQGFAEGGKESKKRKHILSKTYKELPTKSFKKFSRYASIPLSQLLVPLPEEVTRPSPEENYFGNRILFVRGISTKGVNARRVFARFEKEDFAFRNSINCLKLKEGNEFHYKLILGILWSSLAKYFYFFTSSDWGVWHDEVQLQEMLNLPIAEIDESNRKYAESIVQNVNALQKRPFNQPIIEKQLDEAVFNLYYLTKAEKNLIKDRCKYEIDTYYDHQKSRAYLPVLGLNTSLFGNKNDVATNQEPVQGIEDYLNAFYLVITPLLKKGKNITHTVIRSRGTNQENLVWEDSIIVIFNISDNEISNLEKNEIKEWKDAIRLIERNSTIEVSRSIYVEHFLRYVSDNYLLILKRNERRLWSRTAAREDAVALFAQSQSLPKHPVTTNE